jgi:hypothetical protein
MGVLGQGFLEYPKSTTSGRFESQAMKPDSAIAFSSAFAREMNSSADIVVVIARPHSVE